MNVIRDEVNNIIGQYENNTLEYKSVLPPPKVIAKIISSFANMEGGYLIIGVSESKNGVEVTGLENDVRAEEITNKALQFISPKPRVKYEFIKCGDKIVFAIKVYKSDTEILFENKIYKRIGNVLRQIDLSNSTVYDSMHSEIKEIYEKLEMSKNEATNAKSQVLEHYQSILKIIDTSAEMLYPEGVEIITNNVEGKILTRLLFSSITDSFETYLANLLYEIYLACPNTLKSESEVTVKEVLNCYNIDEFINFIATKRIEKLSKGSIETFIKDNKNIKVFDVIDERERVEVKKMLQIRHLFTHKNGIIDKKFLRYVNENLEENTEFSISIKELCTKCEYLVNLIQKLDNKAREVYKLSSNN